MIVCGDGSVSLFKTPWPGMDQPRGCCLRSSIRSGFCVRFFWYEPLATLPARGVLESELFPRNRRDGRRGNLIIKSEQKTDTSVAALPVLTASPQLELTGAGLSPAQKGANRFNENRSAHDEDQENNAFHWTLVGFRFRQAAKQSSAAPN
jgi:hypothetical protein